MCCTLFSFKSPEYPAALAAEQRCDIFVRGGVGSQNSSSHGNEDGMTASAGCRCRRPTRGRVNSFTFWLVLQCKHTCKRKSIAPRTAANRLDTFHRWVKSSTAKKDKMQPREESSKSKRRTSERENSDHHQEKDTKQGHREWLVSFPFHLFPTSPPGSSQTLTPQNLMQSPLEGVHS